MVPVNPSSAFLPVAAYATLFINSIHFYFLSDNAGISLF